MISRTRRRLASAIAFGLPAFAYSTRGVAGEAPLEWIVGYPAGGGSDAVARLIAEPMAKALRRDIIVVNKPGAATAIAAGYVAAAKGKPVMMSADIATLAANPWLYQSLPYQVADLQPVGMLARFPMLLVVAANVPVNSLKELKAWASANVDKANYASAGAGSPHHLSMELLKQKTGLQLTHIPYKGAAPALQDIVAGVVPCGIIDTAAAAQFIATAKLRAIGVASTARLPDHPDVPTLSEQGAADFEAHAWQGLVVPAGTPADQVATLNAALRAAQKDPAVMSRLRSMGVEVVASAAGEMQAFVANELERWGRLIKAASISL